MSVHTHFREERLARGEAHCQSQRARSKGGRETRNAGISTFSGSWGESERCSGSVFKMQGTPRGRSYLGNCLCQAQREIC